MNWDCSLERITGRLAYKKYCVILLFDVIVDFFFTEQCTSPSLFFRFEVTRGDSNRSLENYGFLFDAFFFTCTDAHKSIRLLIWLVCWRGKICRVGLYTELFYAIIPTLFLCFLLICYPYNLLFLLAYIACPCYPYLYDRVYRLYDLYQPFSYLCLLSL